MSENNKSLDYTPNTKWSKLGIPDAVHQIAQEGIGAGTQLSDEFPTDPDDTPASISEDVEDMASIYPELQIGRLNQGLRVQEALAIAARIRMEQINEALKNQEEVPAKSGFFGRLFPSKGVQQPSDTHKLTMKEASNIQNMTTQAPPEALRSAAKAFYDAHTDTLYEQAVADAAQSDVMIKQ